VKVEGQVIFGVPYEVTAEFLDRLIREYHIDYIVHGDDACYSANGQDAYYAVKKAGRFKTIKRTEGVSSTDLVGRMLLCTRDHHIDNIHGEHKVSERTGRSSRVFFNEQTDDETSLSKSSTFLPTTRRLIQFAQGGRTPKPEDKVCRNIYIYNKHKLKKKKPRSYISMVLLTCFILVISRLSSKQWQRKTLTTKRLLVFYLQGCKATGRLSVGWHSR
jgi:hypothetical protein